MGERASNYLKRLEIYKLPFLATIIIGLLVHGYKFANAFINHDGVYNYYSNQNTVASGRWFLTFASGISSYFDLTWINGILSLIYIALTTVVIVSIFEIKNKVVIILTAFLMASFPAYTETLFFNFTVDGYMLAMLCASVAVKITLIGNMSKNNCIASCILLCICCAIYQAYLSFAMVLALTYLMAELLYNRHEVKEYIKWIVIQLILYITAVISYYIIWKLSMYLQNVSANSYKGISELGTISFNLIKAGFVNSIETLIRFFLQWNVFQNGWTFYAVLNIIFWACVIGIVIVAVKKTELYKRGILFIFFLICLVLIPIASCIWNFASTEVGYRPMMLYSLCVIYIFALVMWDKYAEARVADVFGVLIFIIAFNFSILANISYLYMNECYERTFAASVELMSRIYELDEGNVEKIAVIGYIPEKVFIGQNEIEKKIHVLSPLLERSLFLTKNMSFCI